MKCEWRKAGLDRELSEDTDDSGQQGVALTVISYWLFGRSVAMSCLHDFYDFYGFYDLNDLNGLND